MPRCVCGNARAHVRPPQGTQQGRAGQGTTDAPPLSFARSGAPPQRSNVHQQEEEEEGIPMVRENFTFQEHEVPVNAIIKSMEWFELPQVRL